MNFLAACKSNDRIANGDLLLGYNRLRFAKIVFHSSGCTPNDFLAVSCMKVFTLLSLLAVYEV